MELTIRNGQPVYKADTVIGGKLVRVYLNAVTGKEIDRKAAVALDEEELSIYNRYNIGSSASGAKTTTTPAKTSTPAQTQSNTSAGKITLEKAKQIALTKVGGGTVKDIELDRDYGRQVYDIEVRYNNAEYDITVDAATGEILKYKIDD